jgi:hypothetical protein
VKSRKRGDKEFSRRVKSAPVDELHWQAPVDQSSRAGREEDLRDELCASGAINKRRMLSEKLTEVLRQIRGFHLFLLRRKTQGRTAADSQGAE